MYGKIFSDIFDSSIMVHGGDTVYVFIALICLADSEGYTRITAPALAIRIGKPLEVVENAIAALERPDPHSTTPEEHGRRIIAMRELTGGQENRGWWIVNYLKYREIARRQERADKSTERKREWRATHGHTTPHNATTEEGEGEGEGKGRTTLSSKLDGVDIDKVNYKQSATEILNFLNEKTGRKYPAVKTNLDLIVARLREDYTLKQMRQVIAKKCSEWGADEKMVLYLRPKTLFNRTNFANYVGELVVPKEIS